MLFVYDYGDREDDRQTLILTVQVPAHTEMVEDLLFLAGFIQHLKREDLLHKGYEPSFSQLSEWYRPWLEEQMEGAYDTEMEDLE